MMMSPVSNLEMRVAKYIPDRLYGFAADDGGQEVFFHLGSFNPGAPLEAPPRCNTCPNEGCAWRRMPPPPILGERVKVTVDVDTAADSKAPRADRVERLDTPKALSGTVETFDPLRGYGFVAGSDGVSYHLHKSEVLEGRIPLANQIVLFYAGMRQGRPRACHVKVCQ